MALSTDFFEFDPTMTAEQRAHSNTNPWSFDLARAAHELGHGADEADVMALVNAGEHTNKGTRQRPLVDLWEVADKRAELDRKLGQRAVINENKAMKDTIHSQELEIARLKRLLVNSSTPVPGSK